MRANQPMGLTASAYALLEGLVPVDSGRFYEGYWDARYPLTAYLEPDFEMATLLDRRATLAARLAELDATVEQAARARFAAGDFTYVEYEQAELSSSGPVMFLALRDAAEQPVAASLWGECEMETGANGECRCAGELCVPGCPEGCTEPRRWKD